MRIEEFAHNDTDERFWAKMGPHFANPAVRNAVGGFMTSGPQFTWWVAFDDAEQAMGFCAAKREKAGAQVYLTYAYTLPDYRSQGVYTALFAARLAAVLPWPGVWRLYAVCGAASLPMLLAHGFAPCGQRGHFTVVERML